MTPPRCSHSSTQPLLRASGRILPVVPLAFNRSAHTARPVTPDETADATHGALNGHSSPSAYRIAALETPPTPDSKAYDVPPDSRNGGVADHESGEERHHDAFEQALSGADSTGCGPMTETASASPDARGSSPNRALPTDLSSSSEPNGGHGASSTVKGGKYKTAKADAKLRPAAAPSELLMEHLFANSCTSQPAAPQGYGVPHVDSGLPNFVPVPEGAWGLSAMYGCDRDFPCERGPPPAQNSFPIRERTAPPRGTETRNWAYPSGSLPASSISAPLGAPSAIARAPVIISQTPDRPLASALQKDCERAAFDLAGFLGGWFGRGELADFVLEIVSGQNPVLALPVHSIVVSRSPRVAAAIHQSTGPDTPRLAVPCVRIRTQDQYISERTLGEILRHYYGSPLHGSDVLAGGSSVWGIEPFKAECLDVDLKTCQGRLHMEHALSYIAAGHVLGHYEACDRGALIAKALLEWDTIDLLLCFALHGAGGGYWDAHSARAQVGPPIAPTYEPHSSSLLVDALAFVVRELPADFELFKDAPELAHAPRLPTTKLRDPRLSQIRFGQVPPQQADRPEFRIRVLSSILMSVPSDVLACLCTHLGLVERLGRPAFGKMMYAVVGERERRRNKALDGLGRCETGGRIDDKTWDNVYWEERVVRASAPLTGFQVALRRVDCGGAATPDKG